MFDFNRTAWKKTPHAGVFLRILRSDRATGHLACLIRMQPGCGYPAHTHKGAEEVLVLQGGYKDESGEYHAGEYYYRTAGTSHHPVALPGEDCILFAIEHHGISLHEPA